MRLWSGRMQKELDRAVDRLNASISYDIRLVAEDIEGSQAWARALAKAGVLSKNEADTLVDGLEMVRRIFEQGAYDPEPTDEDIHTAVERLLTRVVGPVAGKIHTGRSRNDQVATDLRLWVIRACHEIQTGLNDYASAVLECALSHLEAPMPGYTHLRRAQPVTWGHWVLAHFWGLMRDRERFDRVKASASSLPLGSGALAGSGFAIDRAKLAGELGFEGISQNSIDAVSDRDFALEFLFAASMLGVHLGRFAEMLILFSSEEFGFVELDDSFVTGSSLMPQKRNPDALELARGKCGRLIGNLAGLLSTLKGLPSAYDKDLQEDKEPIFDAFDTLDMILPVMSGLVSTLRVHPERMRAGIRPESMATDLADYLVRKGVPFREAHSLVAQAVRVAEANAVSLAELSVSELEAISEKFSADAAEVFDVDSALGRRTVTGGVAPRALRRQVEAAKKALRDG